MAEYHIKEGYPVPDTLRYMIPFSLREQGDMDLYNSLLGISLKIPIRETSKEAFEAIHATFEGVKNSF